MPDASTSSRATGNCTVRSSGCASRVPLYAGKSSWRKPFPGESKTTAIAVGRSSRSTLRSIWAKPWSAPVGKPSEARSGGRAKKAR